MKKNYPCIFIPPEIRRKMIEIARIFRKGPTLDGPIHESQNEVDTARQEILEMLGPTVFRIKTATVEQSLVMALTLIRQSIHSMKLHKNPSIPSPLMGEGRAGGV